MKKICFFSDLLRCLGLKLNPTALRDQNKVVPFPSHIIAFEKRSFCLALHVLYRQIGSARIELFLLSTKLKTLQTNPVTQASSPLSEVFTLALKLLLPPNYSQKIPTKSLTVEKVRAILLERQASLLEELSSIEGKVSRFSSLQKIYDHSKA